MVRQLVLIGMPGSGKTTIGREVSDRVGASFVDLDEYIKCVEEFDISKIMDDRFLREFRDIESKCLTKINNYEVISLGGGTILVNNIKDFLSDKITIYLDVPIQVLKERIGNDRPLLKINSIEKLFIERCEIYEALADFKIINMDVDETVAKIIRILDYEE